MAVSGWLVPAPAAASTTAPAAYVAVTGSGTACTQAAPCSLSAALAKVGAGAVVEVAGGTYPDQKVVAKAAAAKYASNVVVRPAPGAQVTLSRLSTHQANVTFTGITVAGVLYINPNAVGTRIEKVRVVGDGTFVRSNDVAIVDSVMEGGHSIDGVQIGRSKRVLLEGNTIRNFDQLGTSGLHADCIQIFDSSDITIRGNRVSNCHNSAIIFSGGADTGINRVLVESNFLQGCVVKTTACGGGNILELRYAKALDVTVVNNTMSSGTVRVGPVPGLVFDRNIVNYLSQCNTPMTNTIVEKWNTGLCSVPPAIGRDGNRTGTPAYANATAGDLHLADHRTAAVEGSAPVQPASVTGSRLAPSGRDIDGQPYAATTAGADQSSTLPATEPVPVTVADIVAPTVSVVSPTNGATATGAVTVRARATDSRGVTAVTVLAGGTTLGTAVKAADGTWTLVVDTRRFRNGSYPVTARATDAAGNTATSSPTWVTVRN